MRLPVLVKSQCEALPEERLVTVPRDGRFQTAPQCFIKPMTVGSWTDTAALNKFNLVGDLLKVTITASANVNGDLSLQNTDPTTAQLVTASLLVQVAVTVPGGPLLEVVPTG